MNRDFKKRIAMTLLVSANLLAGSANTWAEDIEFMSLDSLMGIQVSAASKYEQSTLEAPASVTVLTSDDIRRYGWQSLEDALVTVRGFYLSDDRNYSFLGIRGYLRPSDYNNRVLMLLNGQTLNEMTQGQPPVNTLFGIDLGTIDRIEIVRGPGSALYGTGAMFSVINIVTKSAAATSGLSLKGKVISPVGAGGSVRYAKTIKGKWDLMLSGQATDLRGEDVYFPEYDDPETNNGVAKGLDWERTNGLLGRVVYGKLKIQSFFMSRFKGIPTATWGVVFNDSRSITEDTYGGADIEHAHSFGPQLDITGRAYFNSFHYDGLYPYGAPETDNPDRLDEKRIGSELRCQWTPRTFHRMIIGLEYTNHFVNDYFSSTEEEIISDEKHPFSVGSMFAQDEYQIHRDVILTTGLRQTWYSLGYDALVPRAALVFLPGHRSSIKFLYGEAFRAPAITESFYWYPEQSKANPDLQPERIKTIEITGEHRLVAALNGAISFYTYRVSDMINTVLDSSNNLTVYKNTGAAEGRGFEIELNYRTDHGLNGYLSLATQIAEEEPGDAVLSNSPKHLAKGGLSTPIHRLLRIGIESQAESYRHTLLGTKSAPYALLNLTLSTRPAVDPLSISISARNLLDAEYGHPGSWDHLQPTSAVDMPIIPQRGRTMALTVAYTF